MSFGENLNISCKISWETPKVDPEELLCSRCLNTTDRHIKRCKSNKSSRYFLAPTSACCILLFYDILTNTKWIECGADYCFLITCYVCSTCLPPSPPLTYEYFWCARVASSWNRRCLSRLLTLTGSLPQRMISYRCGLLWSWLSGIERMGLCIRNHCFVNNFAKTTDRLTTSTTIRVIKTT